MSIFTAIDFDDHEQITFFYDKKTKLKAIIAIHNTYRGPALGGCRMWPYADEQQAITDALRLSRGMTYKAAMANLPFGGGKAIIIGDSHKDKSPALLRALGKSIEDLHGRYITAEDVGTSVEDMDSIGETTSYVAGRSTGSGNPAPFTAIGLYKSIQAAVEYRLKKSSLKGLKIAVQGLGNVGYPLCKLLREEGADLIVTDIDPTLVKRVVKEFNAHAVPPDAIYGVDADVFSPCALGAILNDHTIPQLRCTIIAGSANNQLDSSRHGQILADKKILYAPDYIINAGGLINVSYEGPFYSVERVKQHIETIPKTLLQVFQIAESRHISTNEAADLIAEERFREDDEINHVF
ncbi:MAG: Glu/Leu/Phe/Val dehydrogenase [Proteobacteria bacterium]|nr:Glu/Leu/Phe/Val dehydrogenase [Pseudomonadota bacterium]